jgi:hypothetical protein
MTRFIEVNGHIVAVAAITFVSPLTDGKVCIHVGEDFGVDVPEKDWPKVKAFLSQDCTVLS